MYLQKGLWNGERIVSEAWVAEASFPHSDNDNGNQPNKDWTQGYGYQFWRCQHNAYRGDGAFGQYCVIMPDQDAVLAITSGVVDMQQVLTIAWDVLLPAMKPAALPVNLTAQAALGQKLAGLALPPMQGQATSQVAATGLGKIFNFEANEPKIGYAALAINGYSFRLTVMDQRGTHSITGNIGSWFKDTTTFGFSASHASATSGAWTSADTFTIKLCMYETPFITTITCRFADAQLFMDIKTNVGFGPTVMPTLIGK